MACVRMIAVRFARPENMLPHCPICRGAKSHRAERECTAEPRVRGDRPTVLVWRGRSRQHRRAVHPYQLHHGHRFGPTSSESSSESESVSPHVAYASRCSGCDENAHAELRAKPNRSRNRASEARAFAGDIAHATRSRTGLMSDEALMISYPSHTWVQQPRQRRYATECAGENITII